MVRTPRFSLAPVYPAVLFLAVFLGRPVWAQAPPPLPASGSLSLIPGLTPPQAALARAIDFVCPNLAALPSLTANQQDLLARCSEMLGNAMFNQTGFLFPSGAASLGLSNAELADVLGKVSQQNMTSQGTNSIETASKVVGARLAGLRRAGTPRFAFNGWNLEEKTASIAPTFTLRGKGGGASADPNAGNRFGVFLNGNGSFGQKDTTDREVGFDFHTVGGTVGADYRVTDTLILGAAFHYLRTNADLVRLLGDVEIGRASCRERV